MATTIVTKSGSGAPTASDLVAGELAVDLTNKRLYTEDSGGTILELGTNPASNVTFGDNTKAIFGAGSDLQIYHNATSNIIDSSAATLAIQAPQFVVQDDTGAKNIIWVTQPAASVFDVRLSYDGTTKLATTATGIDVTGTVTADGLSANGDITLDRSGVQKRGIKWNRSGTIDAAINLDSDEIVKFDNFYNGRYQFRSGASGSEVLRLDIATGGDISFYSSDGLSQALFWDASEESLGIGTTPNTRFHVSSATTTKSVVETTGTTSDALIEFTKGQGSGNTWSMGIDHSNSSAFSLAYLSNGSPSLTTHGLLTVDTSGSVGIGTDSPDTLLHVGDGSSGGENTVRIEGRTTGASQSVATLEFNQITNAPADFIGAAIALESDNSRSNSTLIFKVSQDANTDATEVMRLTRFGNLELSGGVSLGGTAAANLLEDYEEGTWTPAFVNFSGTSGWGFVNAKYTKIGNLVYLSCDISGGSGTLSSTQNSSRLSGVPFSVDGTNSPCSFSTNYITDEGTGVIYGDVVYAPSFSITTEKVIYFSGVYQTS
jgi:hypothetical protein